MTTPQSESVDEGLGRAPFLSAVAAVAGVAKLVLTHVVIRSIGTDVPVSVLRSIDRWADFARNMAVVSGLIAVTIALSTFVRTGRHASLLRRVLIAAFAGIFLPATVAALLLPAAQTPGAMLRLGMGAAHALAITLCMVGLRRHGSVALRTTSVLLGVACLGSFGHLFMEGVWESPPLRVAFMGRTAHGVGQVTYLAVPAAALFALFPRRLGRQDKLAITAGVAAALASTAFFVWGSQRLGEDLPIILYGAQGIELPSELEWAVGIFIGLPLGTAALALAQRDPRLRQCGLAILALLASGFAPRGPAQLLLMVLAATLLSRATVSSSQATGGSPAAKF